MKKIMFNDKYGLTEAVLCGRKTMTRRAIKGDFENIKAYHANGCWQFIAETKDGDSIELKPAYEIGEEVAVAQRYNDIKSHLGIMARCMINPYGSPRDVPGWGNKMFVRADLMPHRISITDIKAERLQDITEEDCLCEGIQEYFPYIKRNPNDKVRTFQYFRDGKIRYRQSPAPACFAHLINDISGRGTWERNPWAFAYTFELVR